MMNMHLVEKPRPRTMLFMLMSADGKISTGASDDFDFDADIPNILGEEGIAQYYQLEQQTSLWTLCTGKTQEKIFRHNSVYTGIQIPVTCVIVDRSHLSFQTSLELRKKFQRVIVATTDASRYEQWPAPPEIILYPDENFGMLFQKLRLAGCTHLTIQSGGTLNAEFMRAGLIDAINIVVAPIIVGGKHTPTLIDGPDIQTLDDICPLTLQGVLPLKHGYLLLSYQVDQH